MADFVRAQIAPKNNCHIVGVNLKIEHNVENMCTVAVGKGTDRTSESGSANKKPSFLCPSGQGWTRLHAVYEKVGKSANFEPQHYQNYSKHWFGAEIICQDLKPPADCGYEVKKTEEMQKSSAQFKIHVVTVNIFSDEEIHPVKLDNENSLSYSKRLW